MAASHPSVVVADGEEVVDGHPMLGVDHILGHVQPLGEVNCIQGMFQRMQVELAIHLGWKIYHCIYLVSPVSVVGEPLEMDHKNLKRVKT